MGVVVRRYIDFIILLIPTPLVFVLFYSSIPIFCSFFKCFSFFIYICIYEVCAVSLSLIPNVVAYSSNNFLHDFCQKQNSLRLNGTGLFHEFIEGMISVNKMVKP